MSLLDLKTNLKSLKYGSDLPGGGDSGLPYIKTDINTVDRGFNRFRLTKFDDGLVRGGTVGSLNASVVDAIRISKFFVDLPKGPMFIIKQVGLQLSNPRTEVPRNPNNIAAGSPDNTIAAGTRGLLLPSRVYNLGINTIAQVPINAFGGHIVRHGILPVQSEASKYFAVASSNNEELLNNSRTIRSGHEKIGNKLLRLATKFEVYKRPTPSQTNNSTTGITGVGGLASLASSAASFLGVGNALKSDQLIIDKYLGGPGSVYGIGNTTIHRSIYSITNDTTKINISKVLSQQLSGKTREEDGSINVVKIKQTFDFALSTTSRSTLNSNGWTYNDGTSLDSSFLNTIAKDADKNDTNVVNRKNLYSNATDRAKNGFFYGVSNYSSSIYISGSLKDNSGISGTLDYRIASKADKTNPFKYPSTPPSSSVDLVSNGPSSYPGSITGSNSLALPDLVYSKGVSSTYNDVKAAVDKLTNPNNVGIYSTITDPSSLSANPNGVLPNSTFKPTYKSGYPGFGNTYVVNKAWREATREIRVGSGRQDTINLTPLLSSGNITSQKGINDLVNFRILAVDTDNPTQGTYMIFRANLTDLSDDVSAEWTDVKYAGRGDKFYIYNGFTRKMSIGFKVAALSLGEMKPMYQKLNFLMGNLMPDYKNNLMRGPLVRMTIGNYIDNQLGILNSLNYKVSNDSPWEIAINGEALILPHIIDVSLSFTPIGSETRGTNMLPRKSSTVSHIAQGNTNKKNQYIDRPKGEVIVGNTESGGINTDTPSFPSS